MHLQVKNISKQQAIMEQQFVQAVFNRCSGRVFDMLVYSCNARFGYQIKLKMQELRQSALLDTQLMGSKRRFGLFSQPPSTAIGDDSPFRQKQARKGENGKPITLPRNMLAGPNRSGVTRKSFLHVPDSIYTGDQYIDPEKKDREYYSKMHTKSSIHQNDFKPSSGLKSQAQFPYQSISQAPLPKIAPSRDDMGRVITKDKNFTTNPTSKVEKDLFKPYRYIADPIDRKTIMQSQERKLSKQKMLPELFRSMSHGDILFSNDKRTYGVDGKMQEMIKKRHSFAPSNPVKTNHEAEWSPARKGHGDPIGKFPEFIVPSVELKPEEVVKRHKPEREDDKQLWKHNGNKSLSRPTPSISYSSMNLRKYF